jgi:hypothetical protein
MDEDSSKRTDGGIHRGADPAAAEESLSEALNGLEQILERRRRTRREAQAPAGTEPPPAPTDRQYTIPLLHDVVIPGDRLTGQSADHGHGEPLEPGVEEAEACRKLVERLANEIEVIVQARVEAAVQEAAEDIREQVRRHLEIMLPEIIEELNALGRR